MAALKHLLIEEVAEEVEDLVHDPEEEIITADPVPDQDLGPVPDLVPGPEGEIPDPDLIVAVKAGQDLLVEGINRAKAQIGGTMLMVDQDHGISRIKMATLCDLY